MDSQAHELPRIVLKLASRIRHMFTIECNCQKEKKKAFAKVIMEVRQRKESHIRLASQRFREPLSLIPFEKRDTLTRGAPSWFRPWINVGINVNIMQ
jgi:hypothetical protein